MRFTEHVVRIERYEYRVKGPNVYAGDVEDAIQACRNRMEELGIRSDYTDSVNVKPEDDDIVVWFQVNPAPYPTAIPVHPDNVRGLRADAWDEGYNTGIQANDTDDSIPNPYRPPIKEK